MMETNGQQGESVNKKPRNGVTLKSNTETLPAQNRHERMKRNGRVVGAAIEEMRTWFYGVTVCC
jgi:hypothetical protein